MDPRNGAILAMGSAPGFDASVFAQPFTQKIYDYLTSNATDAPLLNRATESAYPIGLDVQADHGAGGAREGPDHADAQDRRPRPLGVRRPRSTRTPRRRCFGSIDVSRRR